MIKGIKGEMIKKVLVMYKRMYILMFWIWIKR